MMITRPDKALRCRIILGLSFTSVACLTVAPSTVFSAEIDKTAELSIVGGAGGNPFRFQLAQAGDSVVGFNIHTGEWIGSIQPVNAVKGAGGVSGVVTGTVAGGGGEAQDDFEFSDFGKEALKPELKVKGVWLHDKFNFEEKVEDPDPSYFSGKKVKDVLNGTYVYPEYYVIRPADDTGLKAKLFLDSEPKQAGIYASTDGKHFRAEKPIAGIQHFTFSLTASGVERLKFSTGIFVERPKTTDAELSKSVEEEKVSFNDAWLVDKIPIGLQFSFAGYDITKIHPFNLLRHRSAKPIFRPGSTTDYDFEDSKIVPYGLLYRHYTENETFFTETVLSSEREMQEATSFSVGLNVDVKGEASRASEDKPQGGPKGAAGIKYAREEMKGMRDGTNEMKSFGLAHIHEYALILDKGHMRLSRAFLDMVHDLKSGDKTNEDCFETFGTHYPHAVTYGAVAKATMTYKARDLANWASEKNSVDASVTIPVKAMEVTPTTSYTEEKSGSQKSASSVKVEEFKAVGGSGSWSKESFMANDKRVVPVLLDLRPLYELLSPLYFEDEEILFRVRDSLERDWNTYFAGFTPSEVSSAPDLYQISVEGLKCVTDSGFVELYGSILLQYPDEQTTKSHDLFAGTKWGKGSTRDIDCKSADVATGTVWTQIVAVELQSRDKALFTIMGNLQEADIGTFADPNDIFLPAVVSENIQKLADGQPKILKFWDPVDKQELHLAYHITRIDVP